MGTINLARVDERLVHGQIVTAIAPSANVDTIIVANDSMAENSMLKKMTETTGKMKGYKTHVLSLNAVSGYWSKDKFGDRKILLITKDIEDMASLAQLGVDMNEVNIGNRSKKPESISVVTGVNLTRSDYELLLKLQELGVSKIYAQSLPFKDLVSLEQMKRLFQ